MSHIGRPNGKPRRHLVSSDAYESYIGRWSRVVARGLAGRRNRASALVITVENRAQKAACGDGRGVQSLEKARSVATEDRVNLEPSAILALLDELQR